MNRRRIASAIAWAGFHARNSVFGRIRLRRGEPSPELTPAARSAERLYSQVLSRILAGEDASTFRAVFDVGACDWYYAGALASHFPSASLFGIEADGARRYLNLHRRADLGRARARKLAHSGRHIEYWHRDFRDVRVEELSPCLSGAPGSGKLLFTFFFPFVSEDPCLGWGLPSSFSEFPALLRHARGLSEQLGHEAWMISVHQGEWERSIAERALLSTTFALQRQEGITIEELRDFWPGSHAIECFFGRLH